MAGNESKTLACLKSAEMELDWATDEQSGPREVGDFPARLSLLT